METESASPSVDHEPIDPLAIAIAARNEDEQAVIMEYADLIERVRADLDTGAIPEDMFAEELVRHLLTADRHWQDEGEAQVEKSVRFHLAERIEQHDRITVIEGIDMNEYWETLVAEYEGVTYAQARPYMTSHRNMIYRFQGLAVAEMTAAIRHDPDTYDKSSVRTEHLQLVKRIAAWSYKISGHDKAKPPTEPMLDLPIPELSEEQQRTIAREIVKLAPLAAAAQAEKTKEASARSAEKRVVER